MHMTEEVNTGRSAWQRLDEAMHGLIYGTVMVMAVLLAMGAHPEHPVTMAIVLFGSVLAITLAKAFAEVMAETVKAESRSHPPSFRSAWQHSRPTLVAANLPTLLILLASVGVVSVEQSIALAQGICILYLLGLGGRMGWVARRTWRAVVLGALFSGGIGVALAAAKYLLH
jgi:hypothetical protein